ncbi:MAG: phage protease [Candidatus Binataceae bacterium]
MKYFTLTQFRDRDYIAQIVDAKAKPNSNFHCDSLPPKPYSQMAKLPTAANSNPTSMTNIANATHYPPAPTPTPARGAAQTAAWAAPTPNDAPQWVELLPLGQFQGRDGRGPFRVTDPQAVIAATQALRMAAGIPIDYDHATDFAAPDGRPAPAAGWISELAVRGGAICGRVEWTKQGSDAIRMREYRYISPVFQFAQDGEVVRLLRAGLTNNPNLYLTAICAAKYEEFTMETLLAQLREILGLGDNAEAGEILDKIRQLSAAAAAPLESMAGAHEADPARYVAMAQFQRTLTELNAMRAERAREQAERAVDCAMRAGKLVPAQREWAIAYCQADFKGFGEFAARQPAMLAGRESGFSEAAPHPPMVSALTPGETAVCAQLGVKPDDFTRRKSARGDFLKLNKVIE